MSGWIKLHRQIDKHWIWENSDYLKWWLDILLEVNFDEHKTLIKGSLLICKRGEKLYSLESWAKRWGTNKSKVKRFLDLLQNDKMIILKNETVTTRLTVCNYDTYQADKNEDETQVKREWNASETQVKQKRNADETETKRKRNASETQVNPTKEINNSNKEKKEEERIRNEEIILGVAKKKFAPESSNFFLEVFESEDLSKNQDEKEKEKSCAKKEKFDFRKSLIDYGFDNNLVSDWMAVRKTKKATNTQTAFNNFISEIESKSCDINKMLEIAVTNSWSGFKHTWVENLKNQQDGKPKPTSEKTDAEIFGEALHNPVFAAIAKFHGRK